MGSDGPQKASSFERDSLREALSVGRKCSETASGQNKLHGDNLSRRRVPGSFEEASLHQAILRVKDRLIDKILLSAQFSCNRWTGFFLSSVSIFKVIK